MPAPSTPTAPAKQGEKALAKADAKPASPRKEAAPKAEKAKPAKAKAPSGGKAAKKA